MTNNDQEMTNKDQGPHILRLAPEPDNSFHNILQYDRTGTNVFYEWSLKKRCIRWETLHYDEISKHQRMKNE